MIYEVLSRLLTCFKSVQEYRGESGFLLLSGTYGISQTAKLAHVNVEQVLPSINHELVQVGAWLNVVGYVRKPEAGIDVNGPRSGKHKRRSRRLGPTVIDAVLVFSAGAIKLEDYHSAARSYQATLPPG